MKYIPNFFWVLAFGLVFGHNSLAQNKLLRVVTHDRVTIVTDPKSGENKFPAWGVFPSKELSIRKIMLDLTLGTPDSLRTAHWDYLDHITILRQGGKNGNNRNLEIARMLTPYGSMFGKGWQFTWSLDVTDFSELLRDSVEIEYLHSGYEPDTLGWALTLAFHILEGPMVAKPLGIERLWSGSYPYGDPSDPIEKKLETFSLTTLPAAGFSRIRINQTGHGMDEPRGCSEFCSRWRGLYIDSALIHHRQLWKDCGANPLYPQGGTWLYDRADWCPGDLQAPDIVDIMAKNSPGVLRLVMEPYTATANIQARESISAVLIHYTVPAEKYDVAMEEIIVPNRDPRYRRNNPAAFAPEITFRNLGSEALRSLQITYGIKGGKKHLYSWKGDVKFYQKETVELPGLIGEAEKGGDFEVLLERPNGHKDAWTGDNTMISGFNPLPVMPSQLIIKLRTNNHPGDNSFFLINDRSDTLFRKHSNKLYTSVTSLDTLRLAEGLYHFSFNDTTGDGLEFWAEPDQGYGYLRIMDMDGQLLHPFTSDCGNGEMLAFRVSENYRKDTAKVVSAFSLFPRKVKERTELEVMLDRPSQLEIIITIDGKVAERHEYKRIVSGVIPLYLGYLGKGRIILEALVDGKSAFKGRLMRDL